MSQRKQKDDVMPEEASRLSHFSQNILGFLRELAQRPLEFAGTVVVLLFIGLTIVGPMLAPYPYDEIIRGTDIGRDSRAALRSEPPSVEFPMGTDRRGRDVLSRMLWGARDTIGLPLAATALSIIGGTMIGLLIGYEGGLLDQVVSRILDSLLSIPLLVLALVMISTVVPLLNRAENPLVQALGANNISIVIVIMVIYVPIVTRVVRSSTLSVRNSTYIEAARLRGESTLYILLREIFPSVVPSLVVEASLRLSYAIVLVASLGYLGLGVQPPSPEWGRMVLDASETGIEDGAWQLWFPVLGIATLIISVNLMSDGLRRILRHEDQSR